MYMRQAARAIIIDNGKILVMHRNKRGKQYYTLVGGQCKSDESIEQTLTREIKEETGLSVTAQRLVFIEKHPEPYNEQYIYLCEAEGQSEVAIQEYAEEALLNRIDSNSHMPLWVDFKMFARLSFYTMELQQAILQSLETDFPTEPVFLRS